MSRWRSLSPVLRREVEEVAWKQALSCRYTADVPAAVVHKQLVLLVHFLARQSSGVHMEAEPLEQPVEQAGLEALPDFAGA